MAKIGDFLQPLLEGANPAYQGIKQNIADVEDSERKKTMREREDAQYEYIQNSLNSDRRWQKRAIEEYKNLYGDDGLLPEEGQNNFAELISNRINEKQRSASAEEKKKLETGIAAVKNRFYPELVRVAKEQGIEERKAIPLVARSFIDSGEYGEIETSEAVDAAYRHFGRDKTTTMRYEGSGGKSSGRGKEPTMIRQLQIAVKNTNNYALKQAYMITERLLADGKIKPSETMEETIKVGMGRFPKEYEIQEESVPEGKPSIIGRAWNAAKGRLSGGKPEDEGTDLYSY